MLSPLTPDTECLQLTLFAALNIWTFHLRSILNCRNSRCCRSRHLKSNIVIQVCSRVWSDVLSWTSFALYSNAIVLETLDCSCVMWGFQFRFSFTIHNIHYPFCHLFCKVLLQLFLFCLKLTLNYFYRTMTLISSVPNSKAQQHSLNKVRNKIFYNHQANKRLLTCLKHYILNIQYNITSLQPNTEPWGMPQAMSKCVEHHLSSWTNCFLVPQKQITQFNTFALTP